MNRWKFEEQQRALGFEKMDAFLREYKSLQVIRGKITLASYVDHASFRFKYEN